LAYISFNLKLTINTNIVHILVAAKFSMSVVCPNHYAQYF